jgi:uncharacterized repeat protein (TIGR02543 family)
MNDNKSITAIFAIHQYTLTVNATNGTVTKSPNQVLYDSSATVQLTATPAVGYTFVAWRGDDTGTTSPITITMDGNKTITAEFAKVEIEVAVSVNKGWNIVSLPVDAVDRHRLVFYPESTTPLYSFNNGYNESESLDIGVGYWLKFPIGASLHLIGLPVSQTAIPVVEGWNMIGSISVIIPVATITSDPPGLVTGSFYAYDGSYHAVGTIEPGKGYWVKASGPGALHLSATQASADARTIKIVPDGETPPNPPGDQEFRGSANLPTTFALRQNYPNPFNPRTMIEYDLPTRAFVSLSVYNVLGHEVGTLVHSVQEAGVKRVEFDGTELPSGIYLCKVVADKFTATIKMVFIK